MSGAALRKREVNQTKSSSKHNSSSDLSEKMRAALDKIAELKHQMEIRAGPSNISSAVNKSGST